MTTFRADMRGGGLLFIQQVAVSQTNCPALVPPCHKLNGNVAD